MRSNIFASGLAVVLGMGSPIVGAMVSPEQTIAQTVAQSPVESLLSTGKQQYRRAELKSAIVTYQQALTLAQQKGDRATQIDALLQLGDMDLWIGQVLAAEGKAQQALKLARGSGDRKREGQVLAFVASVQRYQQAYDKALDTLKTALRINQQVGDAQGEARSRGLIGVMLYSQKQYPQAMEVFQQALKVAETDQNQDEMAHLYNWIAITHRELKDIKQAEAVSQKQQELSRSVNYKLAEYDGLSTIVNLAQEQKQADRVLQAYQQQLAIAQAANNPWFQISPLASIGNSYDEQGRSAREKKDYPQAIKLFEQSLGVFKQGLEVAQQMPDRGWESLMLSNIGQYYQTQGSIAKDAGQPSAKQLMLYQQSLPFLQQALAIAKDLKNAQLAKSVLQTTYTSLSYIAMVYEAEGKDILKNKRDYSQAINRFEQQLEAYKQALPAVRQTTDRQSEVLMLLGIASSYRNQEDALSDAGRNSDRRLILSQQSLPYLHQALLIAKDLKNPQLTGLILNGISLAHNSMADAYTELKQYDRALEEFRLASVAAKESGIVKIQNLSERTEYSIYISMWKFYDVPEQYDRYLELTQKLIELAKQRNMPESQILKFNVNIADVYKFRGQYSQALAAYQKILIRAQEIHDPTVEYLALASIGSIYDGQAKYPQALEIYEQALKVGRTKPDSRTSENAMLNNIGIVYKEQAKYSQALDFIQKSLENHQKYYAQYSKGMISENIQEYCTILKRSGDLDKGSSLAARYAEVCDHPDHPLPGFTFNAFKRVINAWTNTERGMIGIGFNNAGVIYASQGDYLKSAEFKQKSLNIAREQKDQNSEATYLLNIGSDFIALGDYDKAVQVVQQALKINLAQNNLPNEVFTRSNLGTIARNQGDYTAALKEYQQALTISQKIGMRSSEATLFSGIGIVYQSQGNYASAMDNYQQALKIQQDLGEPATVIVTLLQIGNLQRQLGQPKLALATHQQALATAQNIGARQREAQAQLSIAADYRELGQFSEALKLSEETLQLATSIDDLNGINQALYSIGQLYTQQNQPEKAIDALQKALKLQQRMGIKPSQAQTLSAIGQVQTQLGQSAPAQITLQQSYSLAQTIGDRSTEAIALANLGELYTQQKQPEVAIVFYKQSVNTYEAIRKGIKTLSKDQQKSYTKTVTNTYRKLADLLIAQSRLGEAEQVLDLLKLQELKDYQTATRNQTSSAELTLNQTEQKIIAQYKTLIALGQQLKACENQPSAACTKLNTDQRELTNAFNQFLDDIIAQKQQQCIKNTGNNCIESTDQFTSAAQDLIQAQPGTLVISPVVLDDKVWILVASEGKIITRYESKVDRITLGNHILEFRKLLENPNSDLTQLKTKSKELYDWLIRPIEPALKASQTTRHLVFSLDRVTRYIPMGTLFDGQQYLAQRYTIATVLSLSNKPSIRNTLNNIENSSVLAVGLTAATKTTTALPNVKAELDAIVRKSGIYPGQTFLDGDFTLNAIADHLSGRKVLHIATHGKFVPVKSASYLVLGNGNPLPIEDIRSLSFNGIELVVLSACQTALGNPEQEGTEIPGLSSYFLNKGASAVMASLWSVDDGSTALLMQKFYQNLSQGMTKAEALQKVQQELIQSKLTAKDIPRGGSIAVEVIPGGNPARTTTAPTTFAHPYYWAPFTLIGNSL